jgi:maleylacetoacetate isomerase
MTAILHDYWRSSASYRVRIALNLKQIAYRSVPTDLLAGDQRGAEYLTLNPQGLVPMLEIDGLRLTQSLAICDFLDARVSFNPLLPRDAAQRAHVLAMALAVACDIHPLNNRRVMLYLETLAIDQAGRDEWYRHWIVDGLTALEAMAPRDGVYLSGESPGLADLCLVPQLYNARRFEVDLSPFPKLVDIDATLMKLSAFKGASPEAVKPI